VPEREADAVIELRGVVFDSRRRRVAFRGGVVELTGREAELFAFLVSHPDRHFPAGQLVREAWRSSHLSEEELRVYVRRLRQKLEPLGSALRIDSQRWLGYCLVVEDVAADDPPDVEPALLDTAAPRARWPIASSQASNPLPVRSAALAGLVGIVIVMLVTVLSPIVPFSQPGGILVSSGPVQPLQVVATVGMALIALGWSAVYVRQAAWVGRAGLAGFLLGFGVFVVGWPAVVHALLGPYALTAVPGATIVRELGPGLSGFSLIAFLLLCLGFALTGLATVRGGVFPAWMGWGLALAAVLAVLGQTLQLSLLGFVASLASRLVLASMCYATWSTRLTSRQLTS
jgi:DNA-binding winged helix-turn-helix (wHTH) protein